VTNEQPVFASGEDGTWMPSEYARGPWSPNELHGGAPAALLARAVENLEPGGDMLVTRLTYEFFGAVPLAPFQLSTELVKPGRRVQIVQGTITADGREVVRVRAMRIRRAEDGIQAGPAGDEPLPPPGEGEVLGRWHGVQGEMFHPSSMEIRLVGGAGGTGAAKAWLRLARPIVAGEAPTGLQRLAAAADFGNGLSFVVPFDEALFVNTDLTVVAHREPVGEWIGLDARSDLDRAGVGQAVSILHDERGRIGAAAQSLYVERRSA
jgi:hypothetical protein